MNKIYSFQTFCEVLETISKTKKRLEIQDILTKYYRQINCDDELLTTALYLSTASIYPEHYGIELGVGETAIVKIVCEITGKKLKTIRDEMRQTGDYGIIAMKSKINPIFQIKDKLTIQDVHKGMRDICNEKGTKSILAKTNKMLQLAVKTKGIETKYLLRLFEGKLKIGLAQQTVLICLANACKKTNCDAVDNIKYAYNQCPIYEKIVPLIVQYGSENILKYIKIEPGVPVKPMLAQPSKNLTAAYKRVENKGFTCEYKYDGERAQIHKFGSNYKVFSRNSEDLTEKYPDLKDTIKNIEKNKEDFILDAEIVAYDPVIGKILPFQILSTRKRKDVKMEDVKIQVCIYAFDCLFYKNSLLEETFESRRSYLFGQFKEIEDKFRFATHLDCKSVEEIDTVFNESIKSGCEGLMIKTMDSLYKPSMRSVNWLKLKKDYLEGMSDTLDLLVIGAYYGKGKRTGTFGGFLLGCYNEENDTFEAICKLGTGFDDANLNLLYETLSLHIISAPSNYIYTSNIQPDVWIDAKFVWEIKAAGLSASPIYTAGRKIRETGISLRFPRFIKAREDKNIKQVTTSEQIVSMFNDQTMDSDDSDDVFN